MDKSIGIADLALAWGLITQCLAWGGVVSWPLVAIWGPLGLALVLSLAAGVILAVWGD